MKILAYLIFIFQVILRGNGEDIKQIYFDPKTTMSESKQDGIIIVETLTGIRSTICMNIESATQNAEVICRMMGYKEVIGKPSAVAFISSKKSTFSNGTFFQNIKCFGSEKSLKDCSGFRYYNETDFMCSNHNQDLHVFCLGEHKFVNSTIKLSKSNCTKSGPLNASLSNKSYGLLKLLYENKEFTICGINRNFGSHEAQLFCRELLCQHTSYARIIEGSYYPGASIGGFKNMKCPSNANSLSECVNVYPYDNERCTPNDNIGLICSYSPDIPDANPEVHCNSTTLSLFWNKTIHEEIKPEFVNVMENNKPCSKVHVDNSVKLSVDYINCGMTKQGDKDTIIYSFQVKRIYPKLNNNIIIKNDQIYQVQCLISRFDSTTTANFSISATADLPIIGNDTPIPTTMIVSANDRFYPNLLNIKDVEIGSEIFVKVTLIHPPSQLVPFLDSCWIESGNVKEPLILNKCPARQKVLISPIDNVTIMFSFKSFAIGSPTDSAFIKCVTSICGRKSTGCIPTCQPTS